MRLDLLLLMNTPDVSGGSKGNAGDTGKKGAVGGTWLWWAAVIRGMKQCTGLAMFPMVEEVHGRKRTRIQ